MTWDRERASRDRLQAEYAPKHPHRYSYVIFDLDGCFSDSRHREHLVMGAKKRYEEFHALSHLDGPRHSEITIARALKSFSSHIRLLFITGRTEPNRNMTERWIGKWGFEEDTYELEMRAADDKRPSPDMKADIVREYLEDGHRILMAFDDRVDVLSRYREMGIPGLLSLDLPMEQVEPL